MSATVDAADSPGEVDIDAASPSVSNEALPVPVVPHSGIGPEGKSGAAVSVGGSISLLAWADDRAAPLDDGRSDILAARYSTDGVLLDPKPIRVAAGPEHDLEPRIAYGAGMFFVAWWTITRFPNGSGGDGLVRGARVTSDGVVLDKEPIELGANAGPPVVTFVKDRFVVAFEASSVGPLRAIAVSPGGAVVASTTVVPENGFGPRLAGGSSVALLAYVFGHPSVTRFAWLTPELTPVAELVLPVSSPISVAGHGASFLAAWNSGQGTTYVRRLDASGAWADSAAIEMPGAFVTTARDDAGYLIAYGASPSNIAVHRFDDSAGAVGPPSSVSSGAAAPAYYPVVASNGARRALAWGDNAGVDVRLVRLDESGASLDPTVAVAPHGTPSQLKPALGSVAGHPLLAVCEAKRAERTVRYARLDSQALTATHVAQVGNACAPTVATGSSSTLLAWENGDKSAVLGALVNADGSLSTPTVLGSGSTASSDWIYYVERPRAAPTPTGFVVIYRHYGGELDISGLRATTLNHAGEILKSDWSVGGNDHGIPVSLGSSVVVIMREGGQLSPGELKVGLLDSSKTVSLGKIATADSPAVASDGKRALVVWSDEPSRRIVGAFVNELAAREGPELDISPPGVDAVAPSVAFDGTRFVVVWRELGVAESNLRGARVGADGVVLDPKGFIVSAEPDGELAPALGAWGTSVAVAYGRFDSNAQGVRMRMRRILPVD